jgi:hypothetical protein
MEARLSIEPSNKYGWVSTEIPIEPELVICIAKSLGFILDWSRILPFDGDENFISEIIGT